MMWRLVLHTIAIDETATEKKEIISLNIYGHHTVIG